MKIPQAFIDQLVEKVDIVEALSSDLTFKRSGTNYFSRCPFHQEKTPSFCVNSERRFFHCYGCGEQGNVIDYFRKTKSWSFVETIEHLAARAGLTVPKTLDREAEALAARQRVWFQLNERAQAFFTAQYQQHAYRPVLLQYLQKRGLEPSVLERYGVGFAPGSEGLAWAWQQQEESLKGGQTLGLLGYQEGRYYDRFRSRLMLPIRDYRGRILGFGGRTLQSEEPKYLNSPDSAVFHKGEHLYGLYEARQAVGNRLSRLIVVEGYLDVIRLHQEGFLEAVAALGTAFTLQQAELAFRYVPEIILCFDGDVAGVRALHRTLERLLPILTDGRRVRVLQLPAEHDPDSYLQTFGRAAFSDWLEKKTRSFADAFLDWQLEGTGLDKAVRAQQAASAKKLIQTLPKGFFQRLMMDALYERLNSERQKSFGRTDKLEKKGDGPVSAPLGLVERVAGILQCQPLLKSALPQLGALKYCSELQGHDWLLAWLEDASVAPAPALQQSIGAAVRLYEPLSEAELRLELEGVLKKLLQFVQKKRLQRLLEKSKTAALTPEELEEMRRHVTTD